MAALTGIGGVQRFRGNPEIDRERDIEERAQAEAQKSTQPVETALVSHFHRCWIANRQAKEKAVEAAMNDALLARKGEYDTETLQQIAQFGGTQVFVRLTDVKVRAAIAWLRDVILPAGERPYGTRPTPVPTLPPDVEAGIMSEIVQEARDLMMANMAQAVREPIDLVAVKDKVRSRNLQKIREQAEKDALEIEDEIDDELVEGGWYSALSDALDDMVTFPAGIVKGPVVRGKQRLSYLPVSGGGNIVSTTRKMVRMYDRVNPYDAYPAPGARTVNDGCFIQRCRLSRADLNAMIGVVGFAEDKIREALRLYGAGGLRNWLTNDQTRAELEGRPDERYDPAAPIDCLECWDSVQGADLLEWGMDASLVPDPDLDYQVVAWVVGPHVIGARINPNPLGNRPFYFASFVRNPDSVWGRGVPQIMDDIQRICNSCVRAIVNNCGFASGPQIYILEDLLNQLNDASSIWPNKVWRFRSEELVDSTQKPIDFFQPQLIARELLDVYDYFFKQASEVTGIPSYVYGASGDLNSGASKTSSGLSMMMNAAAKGLRNVAGNVDAGIIRPSIEGHWLHIMLHDPQKARGDIQIVARASEYLVQQEQLQLRRQEWLNSTNNPVDMEIIGIDGRAEVHRQQARSMKMDVDRIVPRRDEMADRVNQSKVQQQLQNILQGVAANTGIPIASLMQAASGGPLPTTTDNAGRKPPGTEMARVNSASERASA